MMNWIWVCVSDFLRRNPGWRAFGEPVTSWDGVIDLGVITLVSPDGKLYEYDYVRGSPGDFSEFCEFLVSHIIHYGFFAERSKWSNFWKKLVYCLLLNLVTFLSTVIASMYLVGCIIFAAIRYMIGVKKGMFAPHMMIYLRRYISLAKLVLIYL